MRSIKVLNAILCISISHNNKTLRKENEQLASVNYGKIKSVAEAKAM